MMGKHIITICARRPVDSRVLSNFGMCASPLPWHPSVQKPHLLANFRTPQCAARIPPGDRGP